MQIGVYLRRTGCRVGAVRLDAISDSGVLAPGKGDIWFCPGEGKSVMDVIRTMARSGAGVTRIDVEVVIPGPNGNPAGIVVEEAAAMHGLNGYTHDA